tara:strand:- start:730 stop:951 length:222 start_codon:yes stop_codon:yes gene_type:complete
MRTDYSERKATRTYPKPSSQPAGVKVESMEASSEGFSTPTELKQKTIDIPGKSVKTKGTGAATKGLDFISYVN